MTRPNVLIIMSDEHAPMYSGPYGHPAVRTPHLDRLAAEGVTFENAYCNSPLCVPSRMSFMTGRYPSRVGVYDNASPLGSDVPTWAHLMRASGYDVALAGKQHFVGPDPLHGFGCQLAKDVHAEEPHRVADWSAGAPPKDRQWPFPYSAGPGGGDHIEADEEVDDASVAWLRDPERRRNPWALCASFIAPHFPFVVPERFWNLYPVDEIDPPATPAPPWELEHPVRQRMRTIFGLADTYPDDVVRRARAGYYGLISYLDEKIGRLLDTLDQTGQAENTLVIYTSDHGEMNGEHGMWRKSCFFEQSVRVPLQLRWPAQLPRNHTVAEVVSLVDLAASLVTATQSTPVAPLDGADLLPLAAGEAIEWKDEAYAEYLAHGVVRPWVMHRSGRYKLTVSPSDPDELYDLDADPNETDDLARNPRYDDIRKRLRARVHTNWDLGDLEQRVLASQRERMAILGATGWTPPVSPAETRRRAHEDLSVTPPGIPPIRRATPTGQEHRHA